MLKKLSPKMKNFLYNIICACLISSNTPFQWNLVYIYPISKPKLWNCDLDNTKPITLLDTVRKAFVKLLNQCLQEIFIKYNIIKGLNFAGLPHQSTLEPLHIVNNILEFHRLNKKLQEHDHNHNHLYMLFQDMSKAYDRVNIFMLRKAMARLRIPPPFINIITNLFLNRRNSVFTAYGNTDPYDVTVGIDQGEVISPLLWVIYYDPLLSRIQQLNYGYNMRIKWKPDITKNDTNELSVSIPNSAYMDDTIWISNSIEKLTLIFDLAQSFFDLNSMKVNHEKSFIFTSEATTVNLSIYSNYLNTHVTFPTKKPSESTRYLGVWISASYNKNFIKQQLANEISDFILKLKYKPLTDKQLKYIYNMVLIPRLEYRSKVIVLSNNECSSLFTKLRSFIKHKLRFPKSTPNSILSSGLFFGFNDLSDLMIQSKLQHFAIMINGNPKTSLLTMTTNIRMKQLQDYFWLHDDPLTCWP